MYRITIDLDDASHDEATALGDWIWTEYADAFDANHDEFRLKSSWEGNQDASSGRLTVELENVAEGDATSLAQDVCEQNPNAKIGISKDGFAVDWHAIT